MNKLEKSAERLLKSTKTLTPDEFNNMDYSEKFMIFTTIFDAYVKKVAIPKKWGFTDYFQEWPKGPSTGDRTDEKSGDLIISDEKHKMLQEVLSYPDLGLFAMENYHILIDNDDEAFGPDKPALRLYKVSRAEARSYVRTIQKEFEDADKAKPITERWDAKEQNEDAILDRIEKLDDLSRHDKIQLTMDIVWKYAEEVGMPIPKNQRLLATDIEKAMHENKQLLDEVEKQSTKFWWFALTNYGVNMIFRKGKLSIEKIPDEIMDKFITLLHATKGEPTDEQLKEVINEWNKLKKE